VSDPINAFVPGQDVKIAGSPSGPLAGLTFVAKDLFDVAGFPTGGGNPDWKRWYPVPEKHAWAVETLLNAGADLIGKTITDEVSLGILGENPFYGTPVNPAAPDRVPGGSSSGSAAAVAGRLCDFAIGTDTGGSVRVPASFCGLYGMRPTHGRIDLSGMMPQAPSSDTMGWFSRDTDTLERISSVFLGEAVPGELPTELIVAVDAFGFARKDTRSALDPMVKKLSTLIGGFHEEIHGTPRLVGLGPRPALAAACRGLGYIQRVGRSRESAYGFQRRPGFVGWIHDVGNNPTMGPIDETGSPGTS
jgi:amidase